MNQRSFDALLAPKLAAVAAVVFATKRLGRITTDEEHDALFRSVEKLPIDRINEIRAGLERELAEKQREEKRAKLAGGTGR